MAISTYAELKTALGSWLARTGDAELTASAGDFVTLFEAFVNRNLRVRQMTTSTTLTPVSGSATLPSDYLEWVRVTWTGSARRELEYVHPSVLQAYYPDSAAGTPAHFTIEGSTLKIRPTDGTGLEFLYVQKVPALSDSATTNWLLTAHPDLYLFGTLVEANAFIQNPEVAGLWKQRRDELIAEIARLDQFTRSPSSIRIVGSATP